MNITKLITALILTCLPMSTFAYYGSGSRVDRSGLDKDAVETFPIPVLFGVEYEDLVPDFADPRDGGDRSHEGQDMRAPQGTPVVSPTEAVVIRTGTGDSAGKYVYTANPGGETFVYMHLDTIANIDPGDELEVGDFIGTVGDTGNAPDGVYHLHFEVHDEDGDPIDPYDRLSEHGFSLQKKMYFLRDVFRNIRNDEEYATFLVETFKSDFMTAFEREYALPAVIDDALEDEGVVSEVTALQQLTSLIASLPTALTTTLRQGDQGPAVQVLQLYLIYVGEGPARDRLRTAGPTGYFGTVTEQALVEFQREKLTIDNKGVYDSNTRLGMMKIEHPNLNLK